MIYFVRLKYQEFFIFFSLFSLKKIYFLDLFSANIPAEIKFNHSRIDHLERVFLTMSLVYAYQ